MALKFPFASFSTQCRSTSIRPEADKWQNAKTNCNNIHPEKQCRGPFPFSSCLISSYRQHYLEHLSTSIPLHYRSLCRCMWPGITHRDTSTRWACVYPLTLPLMSRVLLILVLLRLRCVTSGRRGRNPPLVTLTMTMPRFWIAPLSTWGSIGRVNRVRTIPRSCWWIWR